MTQQTPVSVDSGIGAGFETPYVDIDEERRLPVPHRYVHGGFEGTETRFSFAFPPADRYEQRFFQHVTPVPDSENLAQTAVGREGKIDFAISSGAYFVETNGGGANFARPELGGDMTIAAFRANAASAEYSRVIARQIYGEHRPYGYLYGGSGGGFRAMGAAENTSGVWDGFVPYVIGSPLAIPNVFTVRMHAMRILRDKFEVIDDAYAPGGSGDPFPLLNAEEQAALAEVTRMGFPPRSWFGWRTMGAHAFSVLYGGLAMIDPDYFETFWTTEGYLGADPTASVHRDRLQWEVEVAELVRGDDHGTSHGPRGGVDQAFREPSLAAGQIIGVRLRTSAPIDAQLADLVVTSGAAEGARLVLSSVIGDVAMIDIPGAGAALEGLQPGDLVTIDNSNVLAAQTYHRHQVPSPDFAVWDQFRGADGEPTLPQRPMLVGPLMAMGASGTIQNGAFDGRMIVVACLNDREAFPWQADWYAGKVREHLGADTDDRFRLWYVDHALHGDDEAQEHPTRSVSYLGALHEALRQLAAWVERGVEPAASTAYEITDGQVVVPDAAAARHGVQPVARLTVDGGERAEVSAGATVLLRLDARMPSRAGRIVGIEWDLDGDGEYDAIEGVEVGEVVQVERRIAFEAPGTYFVTARVAAQGEGDPESIWARIETLARVRVVVV
ncbi:hypothetical protein SAMN05428970_3004 [Agromyces sp. CF514]|uniref:hypothetical protein n=1 Tax=Agromyces sp. CF514 TaxID=1881031 RepID=UPI0008F19056|nr:hypothetical protein [Agromyces sp. CF514]SFR84490.1 hypothetical protein SAMN05428970_3004 [Agromyces sp. CF514]